MRVGTTYACYRGPSVHQRGFPCITSKSSQSSRSVNTREGVYPESGFIESRFGDNENACDRKPRDPDEPRYVKSLR